MKPDELVVFFTRSDGKCDDCGAEFFKGDLIRVENGRPLCLGCADLDHLHFLPCGNTALTRRASQYSPLRAVVVEFSRTRRRYERQGVLVTREAIERAETECLANAEVRARQRERATKAREVQESAYVTAVTCAIQGQFPGCPPDEVKQVAAWTCRKHSGRVGRSDAAKLLDPAALRLAVVAHIRHKHTRYDTILMVGGDRDFARPSVRQQIDEILERWTRIPTQ